MRLSTRLVKVERALRDRPNPNQFHLVEAVPVGAERAAGRAPGLYRDGPEGSLVGLLVFDPAQGEPLIPEGRLAPWGLVLVLGPEVVEPPADLP